jgi:thiol-disulfide isomerase/thioredoxin
LNRYKLFFIFSILLAYPIVGCMNKRAKAREDWIRRYEQYIKTHDSISKRFAEIKDSAKKDLLPLFFDSAGRTIPLYRGIDMMYSDSFRYDFLELGRKVVMYPLSAETIKKSRLIRPWKSPSFPIGSKFSLKQLVDIHGNKFNGQTIGQNVLVINFWFIGCMPCRKEIPALNNLVHQYKNNHNLIFLAIAPDSKENLVETLSKFDFDYKIIPDADAYIRQLKIKGFPTHLVVGKNGNVAFSCMEGGDRAVYWIKKTIDSCLAANY